MIQVPLLKTDEVYSKEERKKMLMKMRATSDIFYGMAVQIRNHPFIEFAGLMNEYIKLCEEAHQKGIDFTQCNVHTGKLLPIESFHVRYLDEKLGCIFSDQVRVLAAAGFKDVAPAAALPGVFKTNDAVEWTSQASGSTKTKRGVVVAVVPEGGDPRKFVPDGLKLDGPGFARDHRSYLVLVGRGRRLYWPRVTGLHPAAGASS